jgi:hypothetical protein
MTVLLASLYLLGTMFFVRLFVGGFGGTTLSCTEFLVEMSSHVWPTGATLSHVCLLKAPTSDGRGGRRVLTMGVSCPHSNVLSSCNCKLNKSFCPNIAIDFFS